MYKKRPFPSPQAAVLTKKICEAASSTPASLGAVNSPQAPYRVVTEFKTANNKAISVSEEALVRGRTLVQDVEADTENYAPVEPNTPVTPLPPRAVASRFGTLSTPIIVRPSLSENGLISCALTTPGSSRAVLHNPNTPVTPLGTLEGYFALGELINYSGKSLRVIGYIENIPTRTERSNGLHFTSFSIRDDSESLVQCEVWRRAEKPLDTVESGTIVMLQARVKVIKGTTTLTSTVKDVVMVDPDIPEADRLRAHLKSRHTCLYIH